jgi:hypothetical protein
MSVADPFADMRPRRRSRGNHPRSAEEAAPQGQAAQLGIVWARAGFTPGRHHVAPDITDCLAFRRADRPWLLHVWEPLLTKAPAPPKAHAYCCYIQTVKFYHFPYIVDWPTGYRDRAGVFHRETQGGFIEWDSIETRFGWDDLVTFEGERFKIGGGAVSWHGRRLRWWMHRWARREAPAAA